MNKKTKRDLPGLDIGTTLVYQHGLLVHLEHFMAHLLANLSIDSKKYCTYCPFHAFLGQK